MNRSSPLAVLACALLSLSCSQGLTPPGEAKRISGTVESDGAGPLQVIVLERCSPRFYVFEHCPGRFLGEARLARPGRFVIEVDPEMPTLAVFAFRGDPTAETECASARVEVAEAATALEMKLEEGRCKLP